MELMKVSQKSESEYKRKIHITSSSAYQASRTQLLGAVTLAVLATASLGQLATLVKQTCAKRKGSKSPALGRATSCHMHALASLCEELQSCITQVAGLFWDLQDLGNLHCKPSSAPP